MLFKKFRLGAVLCVLVLLICSCRFSTTESASLSTVAAVEAVSYSSATALDPVATPVSPFVKLPAGSGADLPSPSPTAVSTTTTRIRPVLSPVSFSQPVYIQIPGISVYREVTSSCSGGLEDGLNFSSLDTQPVWVCSNTAPCLQNIGKPGASLILGHRQWGPIPKVFARLNELESGDAVNISTAGSSYQYTVAEQLVVAPDQVWEKMAEINKRGIESEDSFLVLLTCTPYGTAWKRLLVVVRLDSFRQ